MVKPRFSVMRFDTLEGFFNFLLLLDFVLLAIFRFSRLKFSRPGAGLGLGPGSTGDGRESSMTHSSTSTLSRRGRFAVTTFET